MQQSSFSHMFTPVVTNLLIINALFLFATLTLTGSLSPYLGTFSSLTDCFALHYWDSPQFRPFQIITHMFTHGGFMHFVFNMIVLVMFGSVIERKFGPQRFLFFYIFCGLGAAFTQMAFYAYEAYSITQTLTPALAEVNRSANLYQSYVYGMVGASGATTGLFTAFGLMNPNVDLYFIFVPIPIKAKYMIALLFVGSLFLGFMQFSGDNLAHFAHLGGMIFGFILMQFWRLTAKS